MSLPLPPPPLFFRRLAGVDPRDTKGEELGHAPVEQYDMWPMLTANETSPRTEIVLSGACACERARRCVYVCVLVCVLVCVRVLVRVCQRVPCFPAHLLLTRIPTANRPTPNLRPFSPPVRLPPTAAVL